MTNASRGLGFSWVLRIARQSLVMNLDGAFLILVKKAPADILNDGRLTRELPFSSLMLR